MSLSADSEIRSLTVKVIKARANKSKIPQSRLHCEFKAQQMNILSQYKQKTISCRRLEIKRRSVRNGDFDFRRKAQVRTKQVCLHSNMPSYSKMQHLHLTISLRFAIINYICI